MITRVKETRIKIGNAFIIVPLYIANQLKDDLITIEVLAKLSGFDVRYYDHFRPSHETNSYGISIGHRYINSASCARFEEVYTLYFDISRHLKLSHISFFSNKDNKWIVERKDEEKNFFEAIDALKEFL